MIARLSGLRSSGMPNKEEDVRNFRPERVGGFADDAMFAVTPEGRVYRGFFAVRRMLWVSPLTWLLLPFVHAPLSGSDPSPSPLFLSSWKRTRFLQRTPE